MTSNFWFPITLRACSSHFFAGASPFLSPCGPSGPVVTIEMILSPLAFCCAMYELGASLWSSTSMRVTSKMSLSSLESVSPKSAVTELGPKNAEASPSLIFLPFLGFFAPCLRCGAVYLRWGKAFMATV